MKKSLLLSFLMAFVGIFTANADNVMINVDKAANVKVSTMAGNGETIQLYDGMNRVTLDASQNPLQIEPANGASIVSVTQNESSVLTPSGDGIYRIAISSMKLDIVTSGGGAKDLNIGFMTNGMSGNPFKVFYEKDSQWIESTAGSFFYTIPENSNVKLVPDKFYEVKNVKTAAGQEAGAAQTDGSYTFTAQASYDYNYLYVDMSLSPAARKFKLKINYLPNAVCIFENGRTTEAKYDTIAPQYSNVETEFLFEASQNPLEIKATPGAEIVQVTRNGEVVGPIGWNGINGYIFEVADGDSFDVSTKGAPTDVKVSAPDGNIDLKYYYFKKADGTEIALSGNSATLSGCLGEIIYVTPRPGTDFTFIAHTANGGTENVSKGYFQIVKGYDPEQPVEYLIYGSRNVTGVAINVDAASRVKVVQEGGRGDVLELSDGKNTFALSEIKNSLAFSAADGNEITGVSVNGYPVSVSPNGYFLVIAEEGDYIDVTSRKSPIDATMKFKFNEGADVTWLKATMGDLPVELSNPMTVRSYSTLIFEASEGYVLESLTCSTPGVMAMEVVPGTARYSVTIASADVTELTLDVTMKEMEPSEGNSIVIPRGDELFVTFWETTDKDGDYVKSLNNNTVNEVKTGNWVRIYCKGSSSEFVYIKVNGTDIELEKDARIQWVKVNGRSVIETKIDFPCIAYTNETYDTIKHVKSGNVFFLVNGENVTSTKVYAGDIVKLVAAPEKGYVFQKFMMYTVSDTDEGGTPIEGDTYTFTENDIKNSNTLLFKGVFTEDENNKVYALRGSSAWLLDDDDKPVSALGSVLFILNDGSNTSMVTAQAGETVQLVVGTDDPNFGDKYEVAGFSLMRGFPNSVIPAYYTVKSEDVDDSGVIWICGIIREKSNGIGTVANAFEGYDPATGTFNANGTVNIYDANGRLVATGEGSVSLSSLAKGIYIAVTGTRTFKFVK